MLYMQREYVDNVFRYLLIKFAYTCVLTILLNLIPMTIVTQYSAQCGF